jgi:hypothetical protein
MISNARGGGGAIAGASKASGSGSVIAVLEGLLNSVGKALVALIAIGTIVSAATGGLMKMLTAIFTLIGKLVEPFVNLLIPILLPVLIALGVMARIFNTLVRPLFVLLMKIFSSFGADLGKLIGQFLAGKINFTQFMGGLIDLAGKAITAIINSPEFQTVKEQLLILLTKAAEALKAFLTLDISKVDATLKQWFGDKLGAAASTLFQALYFAASAILGFVAQFIGKGFIDKLLGNGEFDKIKETNKGFSAGVDVAKAVQDIWTAMTEVASFLITTLLPLFDTLISPLGGLVGLFNFFVSTLWPQLVNTILTTIAIISDISTNVWPQVKSTLLELVTRVKAFFDQLDNFLSNRANTNKSGLSEGGGSLFSNVLTANEKPATNSSNVSINAPVSINGSNLDSQQLRDAVKKSFEDIMSFAGRGGYLQKGY